MQLLSHLRKLTDGRILIGTWADAVWAIGFYEKHGFQQVSSEEKIRLLKKYWTTSDRQVEPSVVLANERWREPKRGRGLDGLSEPFRYFKLLTAYAPARRMPRCVGELQTHENCFQLSPISAILALVCASVPCMANAQSYPPVWSNTGTYVAGDMVTDYGNVYRCIKSVTTHYLDPSKTYSNWELYYVRNNTTLVIGVGQTFPTLVTAWTYAQNCHVAQGVYLHLSISTATANLSENLGNGINLDHPCGASISIIGDNENNINFTSLTGIDLDNGHTIGLISGITLSGTNFGLGSGIDLSYNATIGTLTETTIQNSHTPIFVDSGAKLHCTNSVHIAGFIYAVYALEQGGVVFDSGATINGGSTGIALYAMLGGYIAAPAMTIESCLIGAVVNENAIVNLQAASFEKNTYGMDVNTKGHADAEFATFGTGGEADKSTDISVSSGGSVDASNASTFTSAVGSSDGSYIWS